MIRFVEQTGSTNADLSAALRSDEKPVEGDWLVALRQTAGRGRQGRQWFDGVGNFMASTVVDVRDRDPPASNLSFVTAIAVHETIVHFLGDTAKAQLKWPNDVLIGGAKISGILLEMVNRHVVIGVGVNLVNAPALPDRRTIAMAELAIPPRVEDFATVLAVKLREAIVSWRKFGSQPVFTEFVEESIHAPGSPVTVHDTDGSHIEGTFAGLDETDGALRLRLADGSERVIRAGDVS